MSLWTRIGHLLLRVGGEQSSSDEPDELLVKVQRGVVASIGALQTQLIAMAKRLELVDENATAARSIESRLEKLATLSSGTRSLLESEVPRLDAAINQMRGQLTGGTRSSGRGRGANAELGAALVQLLGSEERAVQLLQELEQRASSSGSVDSPIGG